MANLLLTQVDREIRRMRSDNARRIRRPIGAASAVLGKWLWAGEKYVITSYVSLVDLRNGTKLNTQTGEVFSE